MGKITRRAALLGTLAASAALAVPVAAAVPVRNDPAAGLTGLDLAAHHARQLAAAMADIAGNWEITVKAGDADQPISFCMDCMANAPARIRASSLAMQLAEALNEIRPGKWLQHIDAEAGFALVRRDVDIEGGKHG